METNHLQKRLCQDPSCIKGEFCLDVAYSLAMKDIPYKPEYKATLYFSNKKNNNNKKKLSAKK
jgi:hypothetical protein